MSTSAFRTPTIAPQGDPARRYPHAWLWPVGLTAMLAGSVGICVATAVIATRDPSFALEPDYYEQAVAWDESAAVRDSSARLGWSASASISAPAAHTGVRTLTLSLTDATGQPVTPDRVEIVAFHHARRRDAMELAFSTTTPTPTTGPGSIISSQDGAYAWSLGAARAGVWQVRVRAQRDSDVFVTVLDIETTQAAPGEEP